MSDAPTTATPVPHPHLRCVRVITEKDALLSDEQRARVVAWLDANGIAPGEVSTNGPVTLEYKTDGEQEWGHLICFAEYYRDQSGARVFDWKSKEATLVHRSVQQSVALEPESA